MTTRLPPARNVTPHPAADRVRDRLGRPMHDLRISVMDRCNFRCPYCMPKETFHDRYRFLRATERLGFDEIVRIARTSIALGVRKIRLTGGEPLLRADLSDLVAELSILEGIEDLALTTNGVLLAQHAAELKGNGLHRVTVSLDTLDPEVFSSMSGGFGGVEQLLEGIEDLALTTNGVLLAQHAAELKGNGLHRVTVSLDTLDPEVFSSMSGGFGGVEQVLEGIAAALDAGLSPVKVNVVVRRGVNDHTVLPLLERFRGTRVIVRLIEYMDVGNRNAWQPHEVVPSAELLAAIRERWPVTARPGDYRGEVAERYRYDDGAGEIGFISSVSAPFCGACSRARLSSEGVLYTCLFATAGTDLRTPLRAGATDDELLDLLRGAWTNREDRYSERRGELRQQQTLHKIEMHYIGG
jgi:GTP 3',8-cyclase